MGSSKEETVRIPIIDISEANPTAANELLDAAARYGFVFVKNTAESAISQESIDRMFDISTAFFAAPTSIKEEVSIASNKAGKNHGWLSRGVEKLDPASQKRPDVKEAFNLGLPLPSHGNDPDKIFEQPIPAPLKPFVHSIVDFQESCHHLCQKILTLFAEALEIPADWFTERHDYIKTGRPSGTVFRFLYYPYVPSGDLADDGEDIRAGAHSDYGSITLLFQQRGGAPGLEILDPEGNWSSVPVDPAKDSTKSSRNADDHDPLPILVNIGDLLQDWTGGLLKSTVHRVMFPQAETNTQDRYSMAYFCHPLDEALLEAVPSEKVIKHSQKASSKKEGEHGSLRTAKDHLMARLAATYTVAEESKGS